MTSYELELTTSQAKDELGKVLRLFKGAEKMHLVLQNLENIENAIVEKTKAFTNLKSDVNDLENIKGEALDFVNNLKKKSSEDAQAALNNAREDADNIIASAKTEAAKLVGEAKTVADNHKSVSDALTTENLKAKNDLNSAKAELNEIKSAVSQHKEALSKFLGDVK